MSGSHNWEGRRDLSEGEYQCTSRSLPCSGACRLTVRASCHILHCKKECFQSPVEITENTEISRNESKIESQDGWG